MENKFKHNESLEFRQIVLEYIRDIIKISLRTNPNEDNLNNYIKSVESLSDVLIPFFDTQMNKEYDIFENERVKVYKESENKRLELSERDYCEDYEGIFRSKLKTIYRNLFRKLNLLLSRNDYLKSTVYGDESDEVASESEEGGSE